GGVLVRSGAVVADGRTFGAGERWTPPAPPAEQAPPREPVVDPVQTPVAVVAPPPSRPDVVAWRDVLAQLEQPGAGQAAALAQFLAAYPDSPFTAEAEALGWLLAPLPAPARAPAALDALEAWIAGHPDAGRTVALHARAAAIAREALHDCARAEVHDWVVARAGAPGPAAEARAFLGLCAASSGQAERAAALLAEVDRAALPPDLRAAVDRAAPP
ncbi:MAG: hypothetical protein R3F59_04210, partial [Myxococcota bacterium]